MKTKRLGTRLITSALSFLLCFQLATPALAATVKTGESGGLVLTDAEGKQETVDKSWETRFPYGTLAFDTAQLDLTEGGSGASTVKLTLHRLGGSAGRAEADLVLMPAAAKLEEDVLSYANAAGVSDYSVQVELPQPIAKYQPLGGADRIITASSVVPAIDAEQCVDNTLDKSGWPPRITEYGQTALYLPGIEADSYRWQLKEGDDGDWQNIPDAGGESETLLAGNELYFSEETSYLFRCIYTIGDKTYCSADNKGGAYEPSADAEELPAVPEGFVNDFTPGFADVELDGTEFASHMFTVVFAEGESKKEIVFTVSEDTLSEADEFVLINILDARGATLYDSANTVTLHIFDDEPVLPSSIGFSEGEISADKADGTLRIPIYREGALQYPVSAEYELIDGTAKAGIDFADSVAAGKATFAPGSAESCVILELISGGDIISPEDALKFTVRLTGVEGGGSESRLISGADELKASLYNSGETSGSVNLASLMSSPGAQDVSSGLSVTGGSVTGGADNALLVTSGETAKAESVTAQLQSGPMARSYDYAESFTFARPSGYSGYWTDWEAICYGKDSTSDAGKPAGKEVSANVGYDDWKTFFSENGKRLVDDSTKDGDVKYNFIIGNRVHLEHNSDSYAIISISNGMRLYDRARFQVWNRLGQDSVGAELVSYGILSLNKLSPVSCINNLSWLDYASEYLDADYGTDPKKSEATTKYMNSDIGFEQKDLRLDMDIRRLRENKDKISFDESRGSATNNTGTLRLDHAIFHRRTFTEDISLRVHTANDEDEISTLGDAGAEIAKLSTAGYKNLRPELELVPGASGVTASGDLYVGSKLKITIPDSSVYDPAEHIKYTVFLRENDSDKIVRYADYSGTENGKSYYYLEMLWDGMDAASLAKHYTLNVVLTRSQTVTVSLAPSQGARTTAETAEAFFTPADDKSGAVSFLSSKYNATSAGYPQTTPFFAAKDGSLTKANALIDESKHTISFKIDNLQRINFGQSEKDVILYNGVKYAGNADIYVKTADLQNETLSFVWYDEDHLTATSIMTPGIARMERYLDTNDDGLVNGAYDSESGVFTAESDVFLGAFMPDSTYEVTLLEPMHNPNDPEDTAYYQQIVKVFFNAVPRALGVPEGGSADRDRAQIVPYLRTGLTEPGQLEKMSRPEKALRYLTNDDAAADGGVERLRGIYGESAQALQWVDLPLGGDRGPAEIATQGGETAWNWDNMDYRGNLMENFDSALRPIYLDNTVVGDRIPIAGEGVSYNEDGTVNFSDEAKAALNGYLGSLTANDTFGLSIREVTADGGGRTPKPFEASAKSGLYTFPDSRYLQQLSDPGGGSSGVCDPAASGNPIDELNIDVGVGLPDKSFNIGDNVTIIIDGYEVGISVGAPLLSSSKEMDFGADDYTDTSKDKDKSKNKKVQDKDKLAELKEMLAEKNPVKEYNTLKNAAATAQGKGDSVIKSKSKESNLSFNITLLYKYNTMDNAYHFSNAILLLAGGLKYTCTARLTVCPLIYAYITVAVDATLKTSINAARVKNPAFDELINLDCDTPKNETRKIVTSKFSYSDSLVEHSNERVSETDVPADGYYDIRHFDNKLTLGPDGGCEPEDRDYVSVPTGAYFEYTSPYKAIDITFNGRLLVTCEDLEGFTGGVISSDGSKPVTVMLDSKIDGSFGSIDMSNMKFNEEPHTVRFVALPDADTGANMYTYVDTINPISEMATNVSFGGFTLSPTVFVEVGAGFGVDIMKVEVYANIRMNLTFVIAEQKSGEYKGDVSTTPIEVKNFDMAATMGVRAVFLLFSYEYEGLKLSGGYKGDTGKWYFTVFLGDNKVYERGAAGAGASEVTVTISPPADLSSSQKIYTPEDNAEGFGARAVDPDGDIPFQLSGFGSASNAFKLADSLLSGGGYKLVNFKTDDACDTYIVYTITRAGAENPIDASQLVLSKLVTTGSGKDAVYGLKNPVTPDDAIPYIVVDNNPGGDLDFDVWADAAAAKESRSINVVWTSYERASDAGGDDALEQMGTAAKNTVVKTASFRPAADAAFSTPETVSDAAGSHRFAPSIDDGLIFFGETEHFGENELSARSAAYERAALAVTAKTQMVDGTEVSYTQDDPGALYYGQFNKAADLLYGKTTRLGFAVPKTGGGCKSFLFSSEDWEKKGVRLESVDMVKAAENEYYLTYVASKSDTISGETATVRQLYLQKLTVTSGEEPAVNLGKASLLRTLADFGSDKMLDSEGNSREGLYENGTLKTSYQDPYLSNLRFLSGRLGGLRGDFENFKEQLEFTPLMRSGAEENQTFLLFEMNGETYIIPQESLQSLTADAGERTGSIIPFFGTEQGAGSGGMVIGADGSGNICAVYSKGVGGGPSNALYLSKYDADSTSWGEGTMLAMNHMDVYEKAQTENWSDEDTSLAFYGKLSGVNLGGMDSFTFKDLDIALGGEDELVIVTRGTFTELTEEAMYKSVYGSDGSISSVEADGTIIVPKKNDDGSIDSSTGMYVISFGVGSQSIASPSLEFSDWNFAAGSSLVPAIRFTNGGDVAIRAGAKGEDGLSTAPIAVELRLGTLDSDGKGIESSEILASWLIHDHIRAGATVALENTVAEKLPPDTNGKALYFTAREDAYFSDSEDSGGKFFAGDSLSYNSSGEIIEGSACIIIGEKPELSFARIKSDVVGADEDAVTVSLDATAANLGNKKADKVYLHIQYVSGVDESGNEVLAPVDLTDHNLRVSEQEALSPGVTEYTLYNGYLLLKSADIESDTGNLDSRHGRNITGSFKTPKAAFGGKDGGAELVFTLEIANDDGTSEYTYTNNSRYAVLPAKSFFAAPAKTSLALGNTKRLPLSAVSTLSSAEPLISLSEFRDGGEDGGLATLYYDAASKAIVLSGSRVGDGSVLVTDSTTGSTAVLHYTVGPEGTGINIFKDDESLLFSDTGWSFTASSEQWGSGASEEHPLSNDLSEGGEGATISFMTYANSIDLYFDGSISVESDFPGFETTSVTGDGGNDPVAIALDSGSDSLDERPDDVYSKPHTVTITVLAGGVRLDRYTESFHEDTDYVPNADSTAPVVYFSHSFPEAGTILAGTDIEIPFYVLDSGGISSVSVSFNGAPVAIADEDIEKSGQLWTVPLTLTENGTLTITAADTAGEKFRKSYNIVCFNYATGSEQMRKIDFAVWICDSDEVPLGNDNSLEKDERPHLLLNNTAAGLNMELSAFSAAGANGTQGFGYVDPLSANAHVPLSGAGLYMVEAYDDSGNFSRKIVEVTDEVYPLDAPLGDIGIITLSSGRRVLQWSAAKSTSGMRTPITGVKITGPNGFTEIPELSEDCYSVSGQTEELRDYGDYTLTVRDGSGRSMTVSLSYSSGSDYDYENATKKLTISNGESAVSVTVKVDGDTASISVTNEQLDKVIGSGADNVTIDTSTLDGVDELTIPANVFERLSEAKDVSLTIKTQQGNVTLDPATVAGLAESGEKGTLTIERVNASALSGSERVFANDRPVFELTLTAGAKEVKSFDGTVTVRIPYTLKAGESPAALCVWLLKDGKIEKVAAKYDERNKQVVFKTGHFSTYVIGCFPFEDVSDSAWYYENVAYVYSGGLFNGTSETTFEPTVTMSRAMLANVLYRMENQPAVQGSGSFIDLNAEWYKAAVAWAEEKGIVNGYDEKHFGPDDPMTREQLAAVLFRYAEYKKFDVSKRKELTSFADKPSVWALESVKWAVACGLLQGSDGYLAPENGAERAQVAAVMQRFQQNMA